jgi:hypothetical protein
MGRGALGLAGVLALAAAAPALALDLALEKLPSVVEPCPGKPGFVRLPGTRNCTRLSGRVAAQVDTRVAGGTAAAAPVATGRIAVDNRTQTDYGEVRTYLRFGNDRR